MVKMGSESGGCGFTTMESWFWQQPQQHRKSAPSLPEVVGSNPGSGNNLSNAKIQPHHCHRGCGFKSWFWQQPQQHQNSAPSLPQSVGSNPGSGNNLGNTKIQPCHCHRVCGFKSRFWQQPRQHQNLAPSLPQRFQPTKPFTRKSSAIATFCCYNVILTVDY